MERQQLSSPFQSFLAGRQARQSEDYAANRNKLAEMELADAPAQMQRRNALADAQLQGAQLGVQSAQQQLNAEQAKFAYAKLKQAQDSGNPKAFITSQIPDLAAKLQQQGIDINSMDDQSVAQLTDHLARKYAGDAGIAPTVKLDTLQTDGGGILQRDPTTGALKQVVAPQKPDHFAATQAAADRRAQEQRAFTAEQNRLNREAQDARAQNKATATANKPAKLTEGDKRARVLYSSVLNSERDIANVAGTDTSSGWQRVLGSNPLTRGTQSDEYRKYESAALRWAANMLYLKSGATAPVEEVQSTWKQFFPQFGDGPEVIAQKEAARIQEMNAVADAFGLDKSQIPKPKTATHSAQLAPAAQAQQEVTATGPNGQKVVLRNGQWVPM